MYYLLVIAPMDQVFVGPFKDEMTALLFADKMRARTGFDTYVLNRDQFLMNVTMFGPLPIQATV